MSQPFKSQLFLKAIKLMGEEKISNSKNQSFYESRINIKNAG